MYEFEWYNYSLGLTFYDRTNSWFHQLEAFLRFHFCFFNITEAKGIIDGTNVFLHPAFFKKTTFIGKRLLEAFKERVFRPELPALVRNGRTKFLRDRKTGKKRFSSLNWSHNSSTFFFALFWALWRFPFTCFSLGWEYTWARAASWWLFMFDDCFNCYRYIVNQRNENRERRVSR